MTSRQVTTADINKHVVVQGGSVRCHIHVRSVGEETFTGFVYVSAGIADGPRTGILQLCKKRFLVIEEEPQTAEELLASLKARVEKLEKQMAMLVAARTP